MRRFVAFVLSFLLVLSAHAQSDKGQWCGYALIEGITNLDRQLPMLSLITPDEGRSDVTPDQLYQVKVSLDGTKAIIEACWKVFPSRDVVLNLLSLSIRDSEKESVDTDLVYSLFAPEGSRDDGAASVRDYLAKTISEWELPEEEVK